MQLTPEHLQRYAQMTVDKKTRADYTILAAFLTGGLVTEMEPLLGGTADIDLVFIHIGDPKVEREIIFLNEDIHYDISHQPQRDYLERLTLRTHPWKGPVLSEAVVLYDPQHFMDLTQASVRGLFHQPYNIIQRSQTQKNRARERWFDFQTPPANPGPQEIEAYLDILDCAVNAVALLTGDPLTERRFLMKFPERAERVQRPGLYPGLLGMLGAPHVELQTLEEWVSEWEIAFQSLPSENRPIRLHPDRFNYYRKAFATLLESDNPKNILWPLLRTWTAAVMDLPDSDPGFQGWKDACHKLGLIHAGFGERILALDVFLEQIEEVLADWEQQQGA